MSKSNITVSIIGHKSHGKTTLASAITKVASSMKGFLCSPKEVKDFHNIPEERDSASSMDIHYASFETDDKLFTLIDCPGNTKFTAKTSSGLAQSDYAILVVSGVDGAMSQTREHIIQAHAAGVSGLCIFITKLDDNNASQEVTNLIEMELRDMVETYGFNGEETPIYKGAPKLCEKNQDIGRTPIVEMLKSIAKNSKQRSKSESGEFIMPISKVIPIDSGLVLVGSVVSGKVKKGDFVFITTVHGEKIKTTISDIKRINKDVMDTSGAGCVSILIPDKFNIMPGDIIHNGSIPSRDKITLDAIYMISSEEGGVISSMDSSVPVDFFINGVLVQSPIKNVPKRLNPGENYSDGVITLSKNTPPLKTNKLVGFQDGRAILVAKFN